MRNIKNDIRSVMFYVVRDIKRKPREAVTLVAIMSAIMLTLILLMLWIEANWRAEVMPLHEENYHFQITGLTDSEKNYIKSADWCCDTYEVRNVNGRDYFRVRIKWEYLDGDYMECIREVYELFDLHSREPYKEIYDQWYTKLYNSYSNAYSGSPVKGFLISVQYINSSPKEAADIGAMRNVLTEMQNRQFCVLTTQNYLLMPDNFITLLLFTVFLGAVIFIIMNERYRRNLSETGTLRALGFAKWQIYGYYTVKGVILSFGAVLPASVFSILIVRIYNLLTKNISSAEDVYFRIGETVPTANLIAAFTCLFAAVLLSNLIVCHVYRGYTVMDGLRGRETLEIDFVDDTSYRFEKSESELAYAVLYTTRTKKRLLTNALSVAVMVPLPIYYISLLKEAVGNVHPMELALLIFQAVLLTFCAVFVISLSGIYDIRGRRGELSMLRAMGMPRGKIFKTVLCGSLFEGGAATVFSAVLSAAIMLYMEQSMRRVIDDTMKVMTADIAVIEFGIKTLVNALTMLPVAILFVMVSEILGTYIGLCIYTRGSITEGIRKAD